jgi:hypothetical protein
MVAFQLLNCVSLLSGFHRLKWQQLGVAIDLCEIIGPLAIHCQMGTQPCGARWENNFAAPEFQVEVCSSMFQSSVCRTAATRTVF